MVSFADVQQDYTPREGFWLRPGNLQIRLTAVRVNNTGALMFQTVDGKFQIIGNPTGLADRLRSLADQLDPPTIGDQTSSSMSRPYTTLAHPDLVARLTPQQMLNRFRNSPDLAMYADDFEQVLRQLGLLSGQAGLDTASDLAMVRPSLHKIIDQAGEFIWGANAEIAEVLFGERTATGGANNSRIQAVKQAILSQEITTTTDQDDAESHSEAA